MKRKETDNITGILISAVREKKVFSHYGKGYADCGEKVIKDILLEHSTPADKIL